MNQIRPSLYGTGWTGQVIQTGRWSYVLPIRNGSVFFGWTEGTLHVTPLSAWGSRAHAERKAKRIVDRLNRRDRLAAEREAAATVIR